MYSSLSLSLSLSLSPTQDEPLTTADSKKLADSLNLDDMDANLFGSFSRSQSQKRRQSSSKKSSLPSKPVPSTESSIQQREAVTEPKRMVDSGKDKMASALKDAEKPSEAKSILKTPEKPKPKPIKTLSESGFIGVMITLALAQ